MLNNAFRGLVLGLFLMASASLAQELEVYGNSGNWEVTLSRTPGGEFEVCMATLTFENEEAIIFYTNGFALTIGLLLERWQLDSRSEYEIALQFDEGQRFPAKGLAGADKKSIMVDRNFGPRANEIAGASNLYLHTAAGTLRYELPGARGALDMAVDCALENQSGDAG